MGVKMTLEIPTVTFQYITKKSQEVIYNTLKNNIGSATIRKIRGRATIEVYKQKDFPIIEVEYPSIDRMKRDRIDYSHKNLQLFFKIIVNSIKDTESIELFDLVSYTLESNRNDLYTGGLYKLIIERTKHTYKWDSKVEKKYYTSTLEFSVIWSGS